MLAATLLASALLTALTGLARLSLLLLAGLLAAALLATLLTTLLAALLLLARLARLLTRILILVHLITFQLLAGSKYVFGAPQPNAVNNVPRRASFPPLAGPKRRGTGGVDASSPCIETPNGAIIMGRYLLLWLLGIPLPILLLIWVFGGLH